MSRSGDTYHRGMEWIRLNRPLWERFKAYARNEAENHRRVSVQWLIEDVRKHDYVNRNGEPCKVNNSYAPVFARQLAQECPEAKPYIEMRRSRFDGLFGIESDHFGVIPDGGNRG